jgi:hypothetical protein
MAKRKKAAAPADETPSEGGGAGLSDDSGSPDAARFGLAIAVGILNTELARIKQAQQEDAARGLGPDAGALVALYARSLSAVARDQRKSGKGDDDLGKKSVEELWGMVMQIPELQHMMAKGKR